MSEIYKNTQHQKLKAEWTKASTNENFITQSKEIVKDGEKIKIIEQIVLCQKKPEINNKKEEETKSKKCQICEKSFGANYEEHIRSKHELFECPEKDCNKKFKRKSSLRKHSYFHKGKYKYSCEDCSETFIDKSKFHVHCASKHKKIEKTYECKECSKTFTSPDYLKKHQVTHKDEYKYSCKVCNQKFKWLTSLQTHKQTHVQNKEVLRCEHCSKKFSSQRTLERHMRIHQSQKFQCKLCNAVTSIRKDNIMRHIRHLHSEIARNDIPNFICAIEAVPSSNELINVDVSKSIEEIEIEIDDDDDDTNVLIIDESTIVQEQPEIVDIPETIASDAITSTSLINNRVNVIQWNPNKYQHTQAIVQEKPIQIEEPITQVTEIIDLSEKNNIETEMQQQSKCDNEIQLPPKKKAIAKYDPIEHYRKILGLSETKSPPTVQKQSDEQIFPDHWRKRTSQNFLFRR
ncbi:hypothetical protein PVAND_000763 [Polypedilum vanderplanki]|uniref:C2H2-type domain-containing protein n=1 Tax=Polypedilum vanderplanki TaxID=319348 RepID=A0A9J6BLB3_POLVA|nr:hypothetical protein PVAND_000763 [Polypedilum vanderplanki]